MMKFTVEYQVKLGILNNIKFIHSLVSLLCVSVVMKRKLVMFESLLYTQRVKREEPDHVLAVLHHQVG